MIIHRNECDCPCCEKLFTQRDRLVWTLIIVVLLLIKALVK